MNIRMLGPFEVEREGQVVELGGAKPRAVLAVLVLRARESVSAERLADTVWDGDPPASVETSIRSYVSNLRKALEPHRGPKGAPKILRTTPSGYVLDVPDEAIDLRRFEALVRDGRDARDVGDARKAAERFAEALALWRGEALQDFAYNDFATAEASRLEELRLTCLEDLYGARLALGEHENVVGDLEAFCAAHPLRERALASRMLALYRCGRQADALDAYEHGRRRLAGELGVDPSPELRVVHEQILRQDEDVAGDTRPSGRRTLTFLLADVERSTEKLRAMGDGYADVLEDHRRTLREACLSHGGHGIRTYGDGTFAAFDGATDAIAASVEAQRRLSGSGPGALGVRMGIHTGEATFSRSEYVGLAIHTASRIMDAAHGGQVLVSQATRELFEADGEAEVHFIDTGVHELRDIPDDIRLFQVSHPDLRSDFPPPRTRSSRSHNLPHRPTSFVGRERDIEQVVDMLAEARVVTLTGVGGVGKTRLALEVGSRLVPRYPDGVWLCELAPIGDVDGFLHGVATTIGVQEEQGRSMRESLLSALERRESLLILDNCEHLLEPVADLLEDVVHRCRTTDVLATSREALGVDGERSRPVRSLSVEAHDAEAIRLFEDRARAVRPDFAVDESNASDVQAICHRLDGIPLAVELAAARVTSMSPPQIAARLEEGFHFLRSGRRAAVDRHRTLHGAIDWSYAMLSDAEQVLFDRLSVFAGGFTLEAAERVCGHDLDLDVSDGLAGLVARSMVTADVTGEEARYTLLETLRQYGQDRLAERGEADAILEAHARYYLGLVELAPETLATADSERFVRGVQPEQDNLQAAQSWAISSGDVDVALRLVVAVRFLSRASLLRSRLAERAATLPGAELHPLFPVVLGVAAHDVARCGERGRASELVDRALELVEDPDDSRRIVPAYVRAAVALYEGRLDDAHRWNDEGLRLSRADGDVMETCSGLGARALIDAYAGRHDAAIEAAEEGLAMARNRSTALEGWALYCLGEALAESGSDLDRALECLDRSVVLCRANGMGFEVGVALVAAVSLRARHGDPIEALTMFRDVVDHWRLAGNRQQLWTTLRNLVELFGRMGVEEPAVVLLNASASSATAAPTFGSQGERLEALARDLEARMGAEAFAAASDRGRRMADDEAIGYAKAEIDRTLELNRAGT